MLLGGWRNGRGLTEEARKTGHPGKTEKFFFFSLFEVLDAGSLQAESFLLVVFWRVSDTVQGFLGEEL